MLKATTFLKTINYVLVFFFLFLTTWGCKESAEQTKNFALAETSTLKRDLKQIKKEGKLRALTVYSGTSYFLYKGQPMGYEFELLKRFADYLEVELEIIVVKDMDELINKLNAGEGDLLAHGLTVTSSRKELVAFSDYLYLTKQVLVQKKPDNWRTINWLTLKNSLIHDPIDLLNDTVSIRKESSYKERILNLSEELGGEIYIEELPGNLQTEDIIKKVANGEIKYTIADKNIASITASYYPIIDIRVPVSFSQRVSWATRHTSPDLLKATNLWLKAFKKEIDYNVIYNKYFKNRRNFKRRVKSDFYSLNNQEISPYDDLIQKHSEKINWDWRLVAALIYQESRFDPNNSSWANAQGLMQIMPKTAIELGVTNPANPQQSIRGGTTYLNQIWQKFENIKDSIQRTKFTMASYNCGLYHVKDAQKLAKKKGLDAKMWDDNVEDVVLGLSLPKNYKDPVVKYGYVRGIEPYNYVNQIFNRYEHYKQFISE